MPVVIALVGRPNVGKSTLFNRLLKKGQSLTFDTPGVTRDRVYGEMRLGDRALALVDTGGLLLETGPETIERQVAAQAREAIAEAQAILLVTDGRDGLTPLDEQAAEMVRASDKPVLAVVNKVDGDELAGEMAAEFYSLGFPLLAVSAAHNKGMTALLDAMKDLVAPIPEPAPVPEARQGLKVAVLGRPNAGKSSLINALVGEKRLIVSDVPGTTRDAVDVTFEAGGERTTFVDTAGVRRRANVTESLERFSTMRALKSAKRADVALLVLDGSQPTARQDMRLLDFLDKEKTPLIVVATKMDLVPRRDRPKAKHALKDSLRMAAHAPLLLVSSKTGAGLDKILPMARDLEAQCNLREGTGRLNRAMTDALTRHQPPLVKGRRAKFYYLTQADVKPPTFVFFVNNPDLVKPSYARYLEKSLRKMFGLDMAPVAVHFRPSHKKK